MSKMNKMSKTSEMSKIKETVGIVTIPRKTDRSKLNYLNFRYSNFRRSSRRGNPSLWNRCIPEF